MLRDEKMEEIDALSGKIAELKRAEEELRLHSEIIRNMQEGVYLVRTSDGVIVYTNPKFENMFGYGPGEMIGKNVSIVNAPSAKSPEETAREIQDVLYKTGVWEGEVYNIKKDGTPFWCYATVSTFEHHQYGTVWVSVHQDITEWKRIEKTLQESEERYRGLYDSIKDGIVRTDIEGNILDFNHAYMDMLGYTKDEIMKLDYQQLTPAKWHEMEAEIVNTQIIERGYSDAYEKEYIRKDGTVFPISIRVWLIKDERGENVGMWGIVRDVTQRKQAEEEIRRLNDDLKRRITEVEEINKDLEGFSYSISHDLRVPLRAIDGFSKILIKDYADRLDDEGMRILNIIRDSTKKMGQLIDDLLSFSRMGRKEISLAEIDMERLVRSVSDELLPYISGKMPVLEVKTLPNVKGDLTLVRQVIVNLLSNAIKFTGTREIMNIEVGGWVEGNKNIYYVKDNGVGFDMQYADKLFGVFQRLHSEEEFKGTGIGLAIVKRIISRHGGRVWAEGKVNKGAAFYFSLLNR